MDGDLASSGGQEKARKHAFEAKPVEFIRAFRTPKSCPCKIGWNPPHFELPTVVLEVATVCVQNTEAHIFCHNESQFRSVFLLDIFLSRLSLLSPPEAINIYIY